MTQSILIGNISSGLTQNRTPFNINNDAFPQLFNAYVWRGRVKRKRGTELLGRLTRQLEVSGKTSSISGATQANPCVLTSSNTYVPGETISISGVSGMTQLNGNSYKITAVTASTITINVNSTGFTSYSSGGTTTLVSPAPSSVLTPVTLSSGGANLISTYSLQSNASLVPGSIDFINTTDYQVYTEPSTPNGTLVGSLGGTGTVNYATGEITIVSGGSSVLIGTFSYYPSLPVMGLEDYLAFTPAESAFNPTAVYPLLLAFDTTYSYQVNQSGTPFFYTTNFYKTSANPVTWTGQDYQQFWTANYNGALWATNGNPGFQFETIDMISVGTVTTITTYTNHGLVTGDYVFFSEITGTDAGYLNGHSEQVTVTTARAFTVPINTTGKTINNNGIFQTLTQTSPTSSGDGIRWYDGDPTNGTGIAIGSGKGWVNFAPPLTATTVSINNEPFAPYYLVGATAIVPFKDRLLFFGPYIQTSAGTPIYLPDTVIYSWNGTPYYCNPVPSGETSNLEAYFVDQTGFGGWIAAGISQEIVTVNSNEDVLIVGFTSRQTRFAYTGDDILPFVFFAINSEQLGSISTFSAVNLDRGVLSVGERGITITSQVSTSRIDLSIPDLVFEINASSNGVDRVSAIRNYLTEWIYFTYPSNTSPWVYPGLSFMFNYRDNTWSLIEENYTTQGTFRALESDLESWETLPYQSWNDWNVPWVSGANNIEFPNVIGGNQQGFVMIKDVGTGEGSSGYVTSITAGAPITFTINSANHCLSTGDYVMLLNLVGTTGLAGIIGYVSIPEAGGEPDPDNFTLSFLASQGVNYAGTYLGGGTFTRFVIPFIQTKQFNPFWEQGRQVRLGPQRYLFDATDAGQVTVDINLSQDQATVWNAPPIVPSPSPENSSLEYSQVVYTCPEGTNLGLTPANINLQMPVATAANGAPQQIWHRMNTALQGDSVQLTITLSDPQMRNLVQATSEIGLHAIHLSIGIGPYLA